MIVSSHFVIPLLTVEVDTGDTSQGDTDPNTTSQDDALPPSWFGKCFLI